MSLIQHDPTWEGCGLRLAGAKLFLVIRRDRAQGVAPDVIHTTKPPLNVQKRDTAG